MADVKLDPKLCRAMTAILDSALGLEGGIISIGRESGKAIADQLTAAANLDAHYERTYEEHHAELEAMARLATEQRDTLRAQLAALKPLDAEQVRAVVREAVLAEQTEHPGRDVWYPSEFADAIATRVAEQLTGPAVGLSAEERAGLSYARRVIAMNVSALESLQDPTAREFIDNCTNAQAAIDRLLLASAFASAARAITGQSAEQLTARLDGGARFAAAQPATTFAGAVQRARDAKVEQRPQTATITPDDRPVIEALRQLVVTAAERVGQRDLIPAATALLDRLLGGQP